MADLSYVPKPLFVAGQPNNVEDIHDRFDEVRNYVNSAGWVDSDRLAANSVIASKLEDVAKLGLSDGSNERRGKAVIATEQTTTSTSYTYLSTPDRVEDLVLETDGFICVSYRALWKESGAGNARAAIFVGANQLEIPVAEVVDGSDTQEARHGGGNLYEVLCSSPVGLVGGYGGLYAPSYVTTGTVPLGGTGAAKWTLGGAGGNLTTSAVGELKIEAAAGTYDVGVKFKTSSGTAYAKERKLRVWTQAF